MVGSERSLLLPQYAHQAYFRLFAPELRDLVLEATHHGLGERLAALQAHSIPTHERTMPLHKDAPREIEAPAAGLLGRCLSQVKALKGGG